MFSYALEAIRVIKLLEQALNSRRIGHMSDKQDAAIPGMEPNR